ncbi:MAG: DNA methyltransferase, partial [Planctomycetota bacterium]
MRVNEVYEGDCLDIMRQFPDNCIDSIITDPPYDLTDKSGRGGFMGKRWDASGIAFSPKIWHEALRVAKPGATLMAFGGSRTYHRLVCAIEDAGWEIRDCISYFHDGSQQERAFMASLDDEQLAAYLELHYPNRQMSWVYGSGIGLGLDISKAIDKANGAEREVVSEKIRLGDKKSYPTNENRHNHSSISLGANGTTYPTKGNITAPSTPLAKQFDGWNTRLKPGYEPIVVAQKPIDGTYAENAEKWGLAGLNIDGGRIETKDDLSNHVTNSKAPTPFISGGTIRTETHPKGRWPANVIHDGSDEVEAEFAKAGVRTSGAGIKKPAHQSNFDWSLQDGRSKAPKSPVQIKGIGGDSGSASRYFQQCPPDPTQHPEAARFHYCPKAPTSERSTPGNNHPTQKPLSLIRYLAKLTRTPTGGIVLDPFAGSGTTALA